MRCLIITLLLTLSYPTFSWAAVELDSDSNGAIDVNKGGTNATTTTQAKLNLGLSNVDNTSDANKPVSTATQTALDAKANVSCFADTASFNACFALDWPTGGITYTAGTGITITDGVIASTVVDTDTFADWDKDYADLTNKPTIPSTATGIAITDLDELFTATNVETALAENRALINAGTAGYSDENAQDAVGGMFSGNTETGIAITYDDVTAKINAVVSFPSETDPVFGAWDKDYADLINTPTIPTVSDADYDAISWNGNMDAPSKNAVRDKIESLSLSGDDLGDATASDVAALFSGTGDLLGSDGTKKSSTAFTAAAMGWSSQSALETWLGWSFSTYQASDADLTTLATPGNWKVFYSNGSGAVVALGLGSDGQYLKSNGASAIPSWATPTSSGIAAGDIDTSAKLRAILTDETGTGALIFAGGNIGAATATTPAANDNDTSVATSAYVQTELTAYASDAVTLTNKTFNTASTGNNVTVPLNGVLDGAITDPADADDMIYKKVQNAMTLTDIHCLAEGGGTITVTLQECSSTGGSCADIEGAITCDADGAEDDGTLTDASIAAGAWIKVLFSAPTGTVNNVSWTVYGTQTW